MFCQLCNVFIKIGYVGLIILSLVTFFMAIYISAQIKNKYYTFNYILKILLLGCLYLSIAQIWQCVELLKSPIGRGWWIPFVCKHGSLWLYVVTLVLVNYKFKKLPEDVGPYCEQVNDKKSDSFVTEF